MAMDAHGKREFYQSSSNGRTWYPEYMMNQRPWQCVDFSFVVDTKFGSTQTL